MGEPVQATSNYAQKHQLRASMIPRAQMKAIRSSSTTKIITRLQAPRQCIKGPPPPPSKPKGTESRQKTEKKDDPSETKKFTQRKTEEHDKAPSNQTFFDIKKAAIISIPREGPASVTCDGIEPLIQAQNLWHTLQHLKLLQEWQSPQMPDQPLDSQAPKPILEANPLLR